MPSDQHDKKPSVDLSKVFTGNTYKGHKNNFDIEFIELTGQGDIAEFVIITKEHALSTTKPIYIEGTIFQGKGINYKGFEMEDGGTGNLELLKNQIRFVYHFILDHYLNEQGQLKRGRKPDPNTIMACDNEPCARKNYQSRNLADIIDENEIVRDHPQPEKKQPTKKGKDKEQHVRSGFVKTIKGKQYYFAPSLIHPEQYTTAQKLDLGFDKDGTPTIEALLKYRGKDVMQDKFDDYVEKNKHKFKSVGDLKEQYKNEL